MALTNRVLQINPRGSSDGKYKVLRGGSWINQEQELRVSRRFKSKANNTGNNVGFRCVRDLN
jgi:formylglycine-generating enzyme